MFVVWSHYTTRTTDLVDPEDAETAIVQNITADIGVRLIPAQAQLQEFLENAKRADTHKIAIALVRVLGDKSWKSRLVCTKHHSSN